MTKESYLVKNSIDIDNDLDSFFLEQSDDDDVVGINSPVPNDNEDDSDDEDDKIPDWNLITAFDEVLDSTRSNKGRLEGGKRSQSAMDYLMIRLGMTRMQVIVIAMLIDSGQAMTWKDMAYHMKVSRLSMMTHTEEIEELVDKRRWLLHTWVSQHGTRNESFKLVFGVIKAIRHNEVFEPENLSNLSEQEFTEKLVQRIEDTRHDMDRRFEDDEKWLMYFVEQNLHLPLCKEVMSLDGDIHNKCLLLVLVSDYMQFGGSDDEGVSMFDIDNLFPDDWNCQGMRRRLVDGSHKLQERGWIEYKCDDGMADSSEFMLTKKAKDELLSGVKPVSVTLARKNGDRDLVSFKNIQAKELFYNSREEKQVERLRDMLSGEQFPQIQQRLADRGMRTGVAVLLSGGPGTGKTETVRQLARETGRDLLMIDISQVKDKFVGESEKNTKAIFERYKRLCKTAEVKPILFINECDAILGKRMENTTQSADKMQNAMQNILLQALEDLEGIVICTTNLAQSLDSAFERRFLMKIEFDKPDTDVRARIWQSMIPSLTDKDAHTLAEHYNFSGGQCENVMRKATIEEIINGNAPTLELLDSFCKEENIQQKNRIKPITGFAA